MAKSMTGYGRAEDNLGGRSILVEVKSVNSRYFEYYSRLPRSMGFLEDPLKKAVSAVVSRGKAELHLTLQNLEGTSATVTANLPVAQGYYEALADIAGHLHIAGEVTAATLARFSDVFTVTRGEEDEARLTADVLAVAARALQRYDEMRLAEGEKLKEDITARLANLAALLAQVEEDSAGRMQRYTARLQERLSEVLADTTIDEARLLTEAAIFADKTAVDEETVRLRSHLQQFKDILSGKGAMGRKLDFLTQELNREVNTIGSKASDLTIASHVVEAKATIEKIREQVQNIE